MYKFQHLIIEGFRKGTYEDGVSARSIWKSNGLETMISLSSFQRAVATIMNNFQEENLIRARNGAKYEIFLSCPSGYYISKEVEDAQSGYDFYLGRIKEIIKREKVLRLLIMKRYGYDPKKKEFINRQIDIPFDLTEQALVNTIGEN